jgi:signal transduction histidine kinase
MTMSAIAGQPTATPVVSRVAAFARREWAMLRIGAGSNGLDAMDTVRAPSTLALENDELSVENEQLRLENDQLRVESNVRLAELRASRQRIVAAGDAERRRLERDLHDGAQQRLVAVALQLRLIHTSIRRDPAAVEQLVMKASDELARSLEELRELARGLHPAVLEHGLVAALESRAARMPVPTAVSCETLEPLPEAVELAIYFVACEALANVAKHAQARAASIRVSRHGPTVAIEIADDGVGGANPASGTGMSGLADRIAALDGELLVTSPVGQGTVLTAKLPAASRTARSESRSTDMWPATTDWDAISRRLNGVSAGSP